MTTPDKMKSEDSAQSFTVTNRADVPREKPKAISPGSKKKKHAKGRSKSPPAASKYVMPACSELLLMLKTIGSFNLFICVHLHD